MELKRYTQNELDELADILKRDGVISVPTDTVYGLCARISSIQARNKLAIVKNQPFSKSIAVMCADEQQIRSIAVVDEKIEKLIHKFMPGPITLILRKSNKVPEYINTGSIEIGVRMATSKVIEDLIRKTGSPLFMTSANQSGEPICTTLDEIEKACPKLDGLLDGVVSFGVSSTIVDCVSDPIKILREGPISMEDIIDVLNS